jgi:predicted RNA-binding protein with PIN domain
MHLIVDGYNVIRQSPGLLALEARDLEDGRQALLDLLGAYRDRSGHKITVVFDGWQGGSRNETRDRRHGVTVIFSRLGEPADEVIKRLLRREGARALVVSSDRELQDCASHAGAAWIESAQFEAQYLLRQESPSCADKEDPSPGRGPDKKGPSHRLPKARRKLQQRLKKL